MTHRRESCIDGYFGDFGGQYVAETLMRPLIELETAYKALEHDKEFWQEFYNDLRHYVGRPTPLYHAENLSKLWNANIYLKREDLNHTGAHKINNCIGQALLAAKLGKKRIIAETGAGQHGVSTATIAARLGLECVVYMGAEDIERQAPNVYRMKLLGADVVPVTSGSRTLKDALNAALRDWIANVEDTFYIIGTVAGPHPYPKMVRDFQAVIGKEAREQFYQLKGTLPDALCACVGGGSNAIGLFHAFLEDKNVEMFGVEAGGQGLQTGKHAAPLSTGRVGILHGSKSYIMADDNGNIIETSSISAGLDYPGVGPEHAWLKESKRVQYVSATDTEALDAFMVLSRHEGIIPALESSHALAYTKVLASRMPQKDIIVNLSGRGDKDMATVSKMLEL